MYPILFHIGPLKLYTYGLMMALGFLSSIHWASLRAPRYGVSKEFISNLSVVIVVSGLIGGRVAYMAISESVSSIFSFQFFEVWNGGMVFYGGFLGAVFASWVYSRIKKVEFLTVADITAPAIALGHAFGRAGCLMAGCCWGRQCDLPWAITFNNPLAITNLKGIPLHPTQIYELAGNLAIIGILFLIQKRQKFNGQIFVIYLALYALLRPTVEHFRADQERGFVDFWGIYPNEWLSTSTFISFVMLAVALLIYVFNRKNPTPLEQPLKRFRSKNLQN